MHFVSTILAKKKRCARRKKGEGVNDQKKKVGMKKKSWIRASRIGWRRRDKEVVTKKTKQTKKKKNIVQSSGIGKAVLPFASERKFERRGMGTTSETSEEKLIKS